MTPCLRCHGSGREIDNAGIGGWVRAARERRQLTMRQVARTLHLSVGYLCDLELGRRSWHGALAGQVLSFFKGGAMTPAAVERLIYPDETLTSDGHNPRALAEGIARHWPLLREAAIKEAVAALFRTDNSDATMTTRGTIRTMGGWTQETLLRALLDAGKP